MHVLDLISICTIHLQALAYLSTDEVIEEGGLGVLINLSIATIHNHHHVGDSLAHPLPGLARHLHACIHGHPPGACKHGSPHECLGCRK